MKQWFIRTFRKKSAIRCYVFLEDNRVIQRYIIPKLNSKDIELRGIGIYKMVKEKMYLTGNMPTFFFDINNAEPIEMGDSSTKTFLSPKDYQTALNSKALKEALDSTKSTMISPDTLIICGVVIVGFIGLYYMLNQDIQAIKNALESIGIGG